MRLVKILVAGSICALAAISVGWWWKNKGPIHAQEKRIPWTTSRITGSPEPPPPYQTQRAFPKLTFSAPTDLAYAPGSDRLFIVQQFGKVFSIPNDESCAKPDLAIDLTGELMTLAKTANAKGVGNVYGIAFHPQFTQNHQVFICYVLDSKTPGKDLPDGSRVSRFTVSSMDPPRIDPSSEQIILEWQAGGHNGGSIQFGNDGDLYISTGDQGNPNPPDPFNTGQDISDLRSSILRIDVDHPDQGRPYGIPRDNPFVHQEGARPEVYAYGLRNPWRTSFDRSTGNLWVADVGWELWESVHCIEPGGNYGWSIMEGPNPVHPDGKRGPTPIIAPLAALPHTESASITGGVVYRGKKLPALNGCYVFGDWDTRRIWAAKVVDGKRLEAYKQIAQTDQRIVAFTLDPQGEMVVLDYEGTIQRLVPNPMTGNGSFPRRLSETGLFASVPDQAPAPGVYGFAPKVEQWVDGASSERFVAIPGKESAGWGKFWDDDVPGWPRDSVLVRTLSVGAGLSKKRVETQLLHFDGKQWHGYSYAWNEQQSDAELVGADGGEREVVLAGPIPRKQTWHYSSRAQCMTCHSPWSGFAMAFALPQMDENSVARFRELGLIPYPKEGAPAPSKFKLTSLDDPSASVEAKARSYLHVNCSPCHRMGGGGSAMIDVRADLPLNKTFTINAPANLGTFGIDGAKVICPGDPARSVMLYRLSKMGKGHMPKIGPTVVDERAVELISQWVSQMPQAETMPKKRMEEMGMVAELEAGKTQALDQLLTSSSGALSLAMSLGEGRVMGQARELAISKGSASPDENIRDLFERFIPEEKRIKRLGMNIDPARLLAMKGNAEQGKKVFFEYSGGLCARCHRINGQGEDFGPELTHIASKYTPPQMLENILQPAKTIDPKYVVYAVRTSKGEDLAGFLMEKSDKEIVLKDSQKQIIRIPMKNVKKMTPQPISAMPEGILGDLTAQQAGDLLEYLKTLK